MPTNVPTNCTSRIMEPILHTMHNKSHDVLKYTMHTKMSMLEEWWRTKVSIITLTTLTIPILETLNPFHFLVSHFCT